MNLFSTEKSQDGAVMGSFLLSELRDLRKGMETRDMNLQVEMSAVKTAVLDITQSVAQAQGSMNTIKAEMHDVSSQVNVLNKRVNTIDELHASSKLVKDSSWNGPKNIIRNLVLIGSAAAALIAIFKVWPILVAWLITFSPPPPPLL